MEVTVGDYLGVGSERLVGVNVSLVAVEVLAVYGESSGVEYVDGTILETCLDFLDLLGSAVSSNVGIQIGQSNGTGSQCACPVSVDLLAVHGRLDRIAVGAPIESAC